MLKKPPMGANQSPHLRRCDFINCKYSGYRFKLVGQGWRSMFNVLRYEMQIIEVDKALNKFNET